MDVIVVVNPIAGGGGAGRSGRALVRALERRGHRVESLVTSGSDQAAEAARKAEGRTDVIVGVGGDGTVNEILNGLTDPGGTPIAHLARGTANMLARELAIPRDAEGLAALVDRCPVRRLDLMQTCGPERHRGRRFLMVAGVGFDAMVTRAVAGRRRGTLGYRGYAVPIWSALRGYRAPRLEVLVDGHERLEGSLVIACNLRNYGGILRVAPDARCDSGVLDVYVFRGRRVLDLVRYAAAAGIGRVSRLRDVEHRRVRHLRVDAREPTAVQLDGDWRGETPLEVAVERAVVPIVCPGGRTGSA